MREKVYSVSLVLLSAILVLIINPINDEVEATPTTEKYALIAVSSANHTHQSEYEKSESFYDYLIDEGYSDWNIYYYGPNSINNTDGEASVENIENGFEAIIHNITLDSDVVIYISDHIQHISQINFYFNDGTINETQMNSWLDSMFYSELTFIMNGNRSGLVEEFFDQNRTIMSSMLSTDVFCPDYFNITRSLVGKKADSNADGVVTFIEAFDYEEYLLDLHQRNQTPQIWTD